MDQPAPETPASGYVVGAILESSWGYDQTNIDYFKIVRRSGLWLWLVPIGRKNVRETGFMSGTCEPDPDVLGAFRDGNDVIRKPIRRKLHVWEGEERGVCIKYGWCRLWDGKASHWSAYA